MNYTELLPIVFVCVCVCVRLLIQVTYVLEGISAHEDFCGKSGLLNPGDLQVLQ